jgi:two-component system alkaline phosphatase synthesis response regulator PhoP
MQDYNPSILIVDDNEDLLAMLAIILRGRGYRVSAREKFEALEKELTQIAPTLILLDRNLGWTDGLILCRQIRRFPQFASTIILIYSAYRISVAEYQEAGADGCFEKPFGMQQFVENIETWLAV